MKPKLSQQALFQIQKKKAQQPHATTARATPLINAIRAKAGISDRSIHTNPNPSIPNKFRKKAKS